jgi:tubulin-folding cofactor B
VDNTDPTARPGEYNDLSAVEKFELTPEEYESRRDTVLSHLKANKLGRFAETPTNLTQTPPAPIPSNIKIGERCEVQSGDGTIDRRGTIRFVGEAAMGKGGVWVGVEMDEPTGKGDGSVDGVRYFQCSPKHAVFIRADKVTVGDFPEEDLMADDDDDEI